MAQLERLAAGFAAKDKTGAVQGAVAALDGLAVKIQKPSLRDDLKSGAYLNRCLLFLPSFYTHYSLFCFLERASTVSIAKPCATAKLDFYGCQCILQAPHMINSPGLPLH